MVATKESLKKLQLIQNVACRVILRANNRDSTVEMHTELGLLDLDTRRNMHLSFTSHKVIHSDGKNSMSKFYKLTSETGRRTTRRENRKNIEVPRMRT